MGRAEDPLFFEYWRLQHELSKIVKKYCSNCPLMSLCWPDEASFDLNAIRLCPHGAGQIASRICELVGEKGLGYFAATIEDLNEVEKKLNNIYAEKGETVTLGEGSG